MLESEVKPEINLSDMDLSQGPPSEILTLFRPRGLPLWKREKGDLLGFLLNSMKEVIINQVDNT